MATHLDDQLDDGLITGMVEHTDGSARDRDRIVSHALEVQPGVEEPRQQPEVATDGRLQRDGRQHGVLDLDVALVHRAVGVDDLLGSDAVPLGERRHGLAEHVVRTLTHVGEHAAQLVESPVQFFTHGSALLVLRWASPEVR